MSPSPEHERYQSFLRLYTAHEAAIRAFVRRLVPTRQDADDVMQEVAVVLWEKLGARPAEAPFRAWAFEVARIEVLGWRRDKGRDRLVLDEDVISLVAEETAPAEDRLEQQRRALEVCLQKLGAPERDLVMRAYGGESQIQQLAATSGRSVPGFYQWLHRVRRVLLNCVRRQVEREVAS